MKTLLTPVKFRYLNSYVSGSRNELIMLALKLYNAMSSFAGGGDKNSVLENFGWEAKVRSASMSNLSHFTEDKLIVFSKTLKYATEDVPD